MIKALIYSIAVLLALSIWACSDDDNDEVVGPTKTIPTSPISNWVYRDSTYAYVSGIANKFDIDDQDQSISGISVLIFSESVGCSSSPVDLDTLHAAWVAVQFPATEVRNYGQIEIQCNFGRRETYGSTVTGGLLGTAGFTLVDLAGQKRVRGWFNLDDKYLPLPVGVRMKAYGTFDVPYCE